MLCKTTESDSELTKVQQASLFCCPLYHTEILQAEVMHFYVQREHYPGCIWKTSVSFERGKNNVATEDLKKISETLTSIYLSLVHLL